MTSIKRTPQPSVLSRILFDISAVALHLLLIAVAFCTSRDVHHLALWLQIPAEGSGLEHIYTRNCSCSIKLLRPHKLYSNFLPLIVDSFNPMAGEDNRGKHVAEEVLEEDMPVSQRL